MKQTKPGAGPRSGISRRQILEAARRHYDQGETQSVIAKEMGISPSYLARLLSTAKASGWVRVIIDVEREVELAAAVRAKYPALRHVEVVPAGSSFEHTAESIATVLAAHVEAILEDASRQSSEPFKMVVGGDYVHRLMIDRLTPRAGGVSVAPSALTPFRGVVVRPSAPVNAMLLASRMGALSPGSTSELGQQRGHLVMVGAEPPEGNLNELAAWFARLGDRDAFKTVQTFWANADLVLLGVTTPNWRYSDVAARLSALGTSVESLVGRGAAAVVANQFVDRLGQLVPLSDGVPSYEPAIAPVVLKGMSERRGGASILVAHGKPGIAAEHVLAGGLATALFCDDGVAKKLVSVEQ